MTNEPHIFADGGAPKPGAWQDAERALVEWTLQPTDALAVDYECDGCDVNYTFTLSKFASETQPDEDAIRATVMLCPNCGAPSTGPKEIRVVRNYSS